MGLGALPGLRALRNYSAGSNNQEEKTDQKPEYPLRAGGIKVVNSQNHGGGNAEPCELPCGLMIIIMVNDGGPQLTIS